jgi:hypothetical protein
MVTPKIREINLIFLTSHESSRISTNFNISSVGGKSFILAAKFVIIRVNSWLFLM